LFKNHLSRILHILESGIPWLIPASLHGLSGQQFLQDFTVCSKIHLIFNPDYRTADEPGLLQHQVNQPLIAEVRRIQSEAFDAGAAGIEHFASWPSLEQFVYLLPAELILEKIAVCEVNFLLRKKLFRFPAGISATPTIKIDFGEHFTSPTLVIVW
jgi:hypothetical protein